MVGFFGLASLNPYMLREEFVLQYETDSAATPLQSARGAHRSQAEFCACTEDTHSDLAPVCAQDLLEGGLLSRIHLHACMQHYFLALPFTPQRKYTKAALRENLQ